MPRLFYHVMQDSVGNLLFDVSGTMRLAGTATVATIYGDEALTVILPNPMTNHPSFGSFKCFLDAGDYDFYMAKAGYTFETLTGVQGHGTMAQQNADNVAITGGTAALSGDLTVAGLTGIGGDLAVAGLTGLSTAPTAGWALTLGLANSLRTFGSIQIDGQARLGHTGVNVAPDGVNALAVVGQTAISGTLAVSGQTAISGNVGIHGVPAYPLDVYGQVRLGNTGVNVAPDAANALAVSGQTTITGTLGINGVAAYPLDVFGQARLGNTGINAPPQTGLALGVSGNMTLSGGNLGINGVAAYPLDVFGQTRLGNTGINAAPNAGYALGVSGHIALSGGNLGVHTAPTNGLAMTIAHNKASGEHGIQLGATGSDSGAYEVIFTNMTGTIVGGISTTATETTYSTTSDPRLKEAVADMADATATVLALRPVQFRWKADQRVGHGFLATDVQALVPAAVRGEPDAVDAEGHILPQGLDMSKLMPWVVGSLQELARRLDALETAGTACTTS